MALVIYEPFEFWPPVVYNLYYPAGTPLVAGISGMDGLCLDIGATTATATAFIEWELPTSLPTIYQSFLYRPVNTYAYGNEILTFKTSAGTIQALLKRNSDGRLEAYLGWGDSLLATSTNAIANNTTKRVDIKYTPHDTAGIFQVWIDNLLEIDIQTGDTTAASGNVSRFRLGEQGGHIDISVQGYLDCVAVDDAEIPGLIKAKILSPAAAGYIAQMSQFPNSGNPYEKVDDKGLSINLGDAIVGNAADLIHAFDLETLGTAGIDSIKAVIVQATSFKEGSPTPTGQQVGIRSGGNNYFSPTFNPTATPNVNGKMWLTDPADSNSWTVNKINALEILSKLVA